MTIQMFKRKKGTMYRYRFTLKGITVCSEMYEDKAVCQRDEAKARAQILDGTYIPLEKKTVAEMWKMYNEMKPSKPQSMRARDCAYKKLEKFKLVEMPFNKVTTIHLERFQQFLHKEVSSITAFNYFTSIIAMFNWAHRKRIIAVNPASPLDIIVPEQKEVVIFSLEEFINRLNYYKEKVPHLYGPCLLAGFFGLRAGEICAINLDGDFDFDRKVLRVKSQYGYSKKNEGANYMPAKSKTSEREIPIFPFVEPIVKAHIAHVKRLLLTGHINIPVEDGVPFCPTQRGRRYTSTTLGLRWKEAAHREGLEHLTLHKLRHTYATICRDAEISIDTIADILGHADSKVTKKVYAHKTFKQINTAGEKLDNIFADYKIKM
ncbi:MAG: site-specific integrase [Phascolarctobacterium sp.]|nr:site-specific integrase [Phascolarctobacterium sp.]